MEDGALHRHPLGEALVTDEFSALAGFRDRRFQGGSGRTGQGGGEFFERSRRKSFGVGLPQEFLPALLACLQFGGELAFADDQIGKALMIAADDQLALRRQQRQQLLLRGGEPLQQGG